MPHKAALVLLVGLAWCAASIPGQSLAAGPELNPVRRQPVAIGPEADRLLVGFRAAPGNAVIKTQILRMGTRGAAVTQAQTRPVDLWALVQRVGLDMAKSHQVTPSMHVIFLPKTLYGAEIAAALAKLRADPQVEFADIDQRRYPLATSVTPNDPLFQPTPGVASGQWYMNTPSSTPVTLEGGVQTTDLAATDAVSAWAITNGSSGIVIADVDTGMRFDHPDLLRAGPASMGAGFGGRLLPGYDFVGEDYSPSSPYNPLGTYLKANDGDGWDPDPSDPGDWIDSTDVQNPLFPIADCGDPSQSAGLIPSSWHGTRVVGVFGALTNNGAGIAGMSWGPWILPVRALGKCGGYDSDIIAGIEWAAGMPVTPPNAASSSTATIPDNPYPADIINLSVGGSGACPSAYQQALTAVIRLGVLVVASAGNGGTPGQLAPVSAPANCSVLVPGVIAVAGLRNIGTKVGYSSFGAEVSIAAPAGNCINNGLPCLRAIDTTTNLGTTVPAANGYTDEMNPNLGTSFSAPIVSGIAALMRSVNNNLTPAQLAARLAASAMPFPTGTAVPAGVPTCPTTDPSSGECACPNGGNQCGAGMVNARQAVQAAQRPIGVISIPASVAAGSVFDASKSVAACDTSAATPVPLSIVSYAWTAAPASIILSGAATAQVTVNPAAGTLTLTLTDSAGNVDVETVTLTAGSAASTAPTSAGTSAMACPAALSVSPSAPTVTESFSPSSVGENAVSKLMITLSNPNGFTLIQSSISATLPGNLLIPTTPAPATTCTGTGISLTNTTASVSLSGATIPANGSCTIDVPVNSVSAGSYASVIPAQALSTVPAGGNRASASATLTVTAPSGGGGGALEGLDLLCLGAVLLAGRLKWAA